MMEEDGKRANMKAKEISAAETSDLRAMPSDRHTVLTEEALLGELSKRVPSASHHDYDQNL